MILDMNQSVDLDWDIELDVRNLYCPIPILRAKKVLATMNSGQILKVIATDEGAPEDFCAFGKQTGNTLLTSSAVSGEFTIYIRRR